MRVLFNLGLALVIFFVCRNGNVAESSNILAVFPFPGKSQYIFAEHYLKQLAVRGHNVTVINTFGSEKNKENFRVIGAKKIHKLMAAFGNVDYNQVAGQWKILSMTTEFLNLLTANILDDEIVKLLLENGNFDLVIMETVQNEALFGLAHHFGALTIGISSYGTDRHIDEMMGNISPLSYNPMLLSSRTEKMNFKDRLWNVWEASVVWLHKRLVHLPSQRALYAKYFPLAKNTLEDVMDSFSLMLLGQHFSLSYARPYLPNMIEVGGLHLNQERKTKELPPDIFKFVDEWKAGVIYFSMGSNIKSADLPPATRKILMDTFSSLSQGVLWKFEEDQLDDKPKNVLIKKWFPQPDILAHPNVVLFITHGGLLSTIESIYFGKPVLGLPIFYDQHLNIQRAKQAGYGLGVDIWHTNFTELRSQIVELLFNERYTRAAQEKSKLYRDQKDTALDRAIWWTEYVLRHKGAAHLRSASRDLNFAQLHGLDTWGVFVGVILLSGLVLLFVLIGLCRFINNLVIKSRTSSVLKIKTT